ncbi:uncharacterized protein [Choristoneura fumiferana]|uniref:uncharacterized protein n=1 Tax=Choristoneura fumiferana TaxID=7141 RepID=UPI003D15E2FA
MAFDLSPRRSWVQTRAHISEFLKFMSEIGPVKSKNNEDQRPRGRGRGRGRERGRGRGRGQGKGLAQPRELFPQSSSPSPPSPGPGPSSRSYEEEKAVILKRLADTKKRLNAIPSETRNTYVAKKREKQLERFLLPDAPPRKQTRKQSPNRSECRLMPGSPATPPARKLMPWEIIEDDPACDELATTPRQQRLEAECDTPTSVLSLDSAVEVPPNKHFSRICVSYATHNAINIV